MPTPGPTPTGITSTNTLALWGDSRTEGIGAATGARFADFLKTLLPGIAIVNNGRGGQSASEVIARQGGEPTMLAIEGNALPASGSAKVTALSANVFRYGGDLNAKVGFSGTVAGVAGALENDGQGGITFTRTTAGAAASVSNPVAFVPDEGVRLKSAAMFLCVGENRGQFDVDNTVRLVRAAVAYLDQSNRRYVVAGVVPNRLAVPGTGSGLIAAYANLNGSLKSTFGNAYLDLPFPPTDMEMATVGYTPTAEDRAAIAIGLYPIGMFADDAHLISAAQQIWALRVRKFYSDAGWA